MITTDVEAFAYAHAAHEAYVRCRMRAKARPDDVEADWKLIGAALQRLASALELGMRRGDFLAYFREAHYAVHRCWTKDVGTPGYVKDDWRTIDTTLGRYARDAATRIGIGGTEPLL